MKPLSLVCSALLLAPRVCVAVEPRPTVREGVGVNIQFLDPRPGEMKMLAASGVRWVRVDFKWSIIETLKEQYDFAAYDRLVAALEQYKIRPIFILDYANKFYDNSLSPYTDNGVKAFARWAAAGASHFKGRGILWEMYNEPNGGFWRPKPNVAPYIKLALAVGAAIRQVAPGEEYIGPAINSFDLGWMEFCFKAGLLKYWSAVSVHAYRATEPETASADFLALSTLIQRYAPEGKQIPIISGEWGYASGPGAFGGDEARQGKFLARSWLNNLANGIPISIWYDWHDDGSDPANEQHHFGIVHYPYEATHDPVYSPKPAYYAAQTLTTLLDGYRFNKRLSAGRSNDYVLMFRRGDAARVVVWTTAPAPHPVVIPASPGGSWSSRTRVRNSLLSPQAKTASTCSRLTLRNTWRRRSLIRFGEWPLPGKPFESVLGLS
jgi:polysaccharide biosynthesis protein PslG